MKDPSEIDWDAPIPYDPSNPGVWAMQELQRLLRGDCEAVYKELTKASVVILMHLRDEHHLSEADLLMLTLSVQGEMEDSDPTPDSPSWESLLKKEHE